MTLAVHALIADDEPVLRLHLRELLAEYWPELEVVAMASNGVEAVQLVQQHQPEVLFFDIRMPGRTGLEAAAELQQLGVLQQSELVFLTAYDQYAVEAFERQALDYLLKPVDEKRLQQSIDRIQQRLLQRSQSNTPEQVDWQRLQQLLQQPGSAGYLQWINAAKGDSVHVLSVDQVMFFRAEDKYTTLVTEQGEFLLRRSLKQLEQELDPNKFWRVHRHTMVRAALVRKVRRDFLGHSWLTLAGWQQEIPISRRLADRFKQM